VRGTLAITAVVGVAGVLALVAGIAITKLVRRLFGDGMRRPIPTQ
jgi:hypothetical protein